MINFIQLNYNNLNNIMVINNDIYDKFLQKVIKENLNEITKDFYFLCQEYNISDKNLIKNFINYILYNNKITNIEKFLSFLENILHVKYNNNVLYYFLSSVKSFVVS